MLYLKCLCDNTFKFKLILPQCMSCVMTYALPLLDLTAILCSVFVRTFIEDLLVLKYISRKSLLFSISDKQTILFKPSKLLVDFFNLICIKLFLVLSREVTYNLKAFPKSLVKNINKNVLF